MSKQRPELTVSFEIPLCQLQLPHQPNRILKKNGLTKPQRDWTEMTNNTLSLSAATRSEGPKAHLKRVNELHHHLRVAKVKERTRERRPEILRFSTSRAPQSSSESEEDTRRKPAGKSRTKKILRAGPSKIDMFGGIEMVVSMRNARVV